MGWSAEREIFREAAAVAPPLCHVDEDRPPVGGFTRVQTGRMAPQPSGVHDKGEKEKESKDLQRTTLDPPRYGPGRSHQPSIPTSSGSRGSRSIYGAGPGRAAARAGYW